MAAAHLYGPTVVTVSRDLNHLLPDVETSASDDIYVVDDLDNGTEPPPPPPIRSFSGVTHRERTRHRLSVPKDIIGFWAKLFEGACSADVYIATEGSSYLLAHYNFLCIASPVLRRLLKEAKIENGIRYIKIIGVPAEAVCAFLRFLYTSRYEEEEMRRFVLHLLVLSHVYAVPCLKLSCTEYIERSWLTKDNVVDVLQLARNCDAPRLSVCCVRFILQEFKSISATEGWKVMKRSNPALELELVESAIEADSRKQGRIRKMAEAKTFSRVSAALDALLHISRDGCSTIGSRDKSLKGIDVTCSFPACKGVETLLRHFSGCKTRVSGGCADCRRMWQLLELHSRVCEEPEPCTVPLCRTFKGKMQYQTKKEESKWKLLVSKMVAAKIAHLPIKVFKHQQKHDAA